MINQLADKILTPDQQLWLKYVYRQNTADGKVSERAFKVEFKDKISDDFNSSKISRRLYKFNSITILGICLIDPESEIIADANKVIKGVNEIFKATPNIETIAVADIESKTGLDIKKIPKIFRHFAFIGMFYKPSKYDYLGWLASGGITILTMAYFSISQKTQIPIFSFDVDEKVFNEYFKYANIEQVLEDLVEELNNPEINNMRATNEETPEQKRFQVLKTIYDLAEGSPSEIIIYQTIEQKTGIDSNKMTGILQYLEQRHLIVMGGEWAQITSDGIDQVETIKIHPEKATSHFPANIYNTNIYGSVAGIQQGGKNNIQNNTQNLNTDFNEAIEKLLSLVEKSSLNSIKKIQTKSDITQIKELATLEQTPEVLEMANSKIEAVKEVISMTADMTSLGIVLIPILQAAFGG